MPLHTATVGQTTASVEHMVDARWIMAYAAALNDFDPQMMDTAAHSPVVAHPVFPVCVEWPLVLAAGRVPGSETVTRAEAARGVHAAHDLHIHRPIRAGDVLRTAAQIVSLDARKPGAVQMTRLETVDAAGKPVCTTWQTGITRGVAITGEPRVIAHAPASPGDEGTEHCDIVTSLAVSTGAAHVYTECAHIWNPIHSDRAVALAAGLPDIILHGTATLALAVSSIVKLSADVANGLLLGGDITRVRRLGGRFSAMVPVPDTLRLEVYARAADGVRFRVRNGMGQEAISHGFLCWK